METEDVATDYAGIPGWDKVDALAEALLGLRGLSVTATQAEKIKSLYAKLTDFDRAPLTYEAKQRKVARGRFARSKGNRSGHVGEEAVKRYLILKIYFHLVHHLNHRCFLSGGSPALSPSKSRVVEAICIRLCDKHTQPRRSVESGRRGYVSRWKLILEEYSKVQSRLFNSSTLMAETNLALYTINETTLRQWYV